MVNLDSIGSQMGLQGFWSFLAPILGAIGILILGWVVALLIAGASKKIFSKLSLNQRIGQYFGNDADVEGILSKIILWLIFAIAIVLSLDILNLKAISGPMGEMIANLFGAVPKLLKAAVLVAIAWLLATLLRAGITKAFAQTDLDEKISGELGVATFSNNIGQVVFWLVIFLFIPAVLDVLQIDGLLAPFQQMLSRAFSFIPDLFLAGVVAVVGYMLAKLARNITERFLHSIDLQKFVDKTGFLPTTNFLNLIGSVVFALVIIPVAIIALEILNIKSISVPATNMLNQVGSATLNVIIGVLVLVVGFFVARFIANLISGILANTGLDELPSRWNMQQYFGEKPVSTWIGYFIIAFAMLLFSTEAVKFLQFDQVSNLLVLLINFVSNVLLGTVILAVGVCLANIVATTIQRADNRNSAKWLANLVRVLIIGLVLAIGLRAMGIADSIVNLAFALTLGAVAVAFAIAFGFGGREPAERLLNDLINRAKEEADKPAYEKDENESAEDELTEEERARQNELELGLPSKRYTRENEQDL